MNGALQDDDDLPQFTSPEKRPSKFLLYAGEQNIGIASAQIIKTWEEAAHEWIFPNFVGGLAHFRQQLGDNVSAPIMIFMDITVHEEFRRQKLGSAGMCAMMRYLRQEGACVAFLRIGTPPGESWATGKIWRQEMYEKLGWAVLENHPDESGDVPVMWHHMTGELSCQRVDEINLELSHDEP